MTYQTEALVPKIRIVLSGEGTGFVYSNPPTLTEEDLEDAQARFTALRVNLETFYDAVAEGVLLNRVVGLTSYQSFMNQCLERVKRDSSFSNTLTKLLHGSHSRSHSISTHLPWISIFIDYFSSTPIPKNLQAVRDANSTLGTLADIIENSKDFYDSAKRGVKVPVLNEGSTFGVQSIDGLTVTVFGDDRPVRPQEVSADTSTVHVDDQVFYNGLPADRAKYPTLLMQEESQIALTVKNNSKGKLYMVVPTINGIPMKAEQIGFFYDGFETSPFPATSIRPLATYLKPGEESTFDRFYVNRSGIATKKDDSYITSDLYLRKEELSFILARAFERGMTDEQKYVIGGCRDEHLRQQIMHESRLNAVTQFLKYLSEARETPIYINRPEIADSKASSELDNPLLGSLGLLVVDVTAPPVEDRHEHSHISLTRMEGDGGIATLSYLGDTRGMGAAGLAHIGAGADRAAAKTDFWSTMKYDDMLHSFAGYVPINIMSLRN